MIKRLLLLNGLAVLGVVLHHASGYGFRAMFSWTNRYLPVSVPNYDQVGSLPFYIIVLIQQLDGFTLPAFMFVSGFFVAFTAKGSRSSLKWNTLTTRVRNLLIPFVIWTAIFFIVLARRLPTNLDEVFSRYYYILLLCQFYVLSPLIVLLARTRWRLLLLVLGLVEVAAGGLPQYLDFLGVPVPALEQILRLTPKWLAPNLLFWFALGVVAGLQRQQLALWLTRFRWHLLVAVIILCPLMLLDYMVLARFSEQQWLGPYAGGLSRTVYAGAFILCFLAFENAPIPFAKQLSELGSKSLGIYLVHGPVMYVAAVIMYRATPQVLGYQFLYQGILIGVGLGVPLLLMYAVSKSPTRRFYRYVFG